MMNLRTISVLFARDFKAYFLSPIAYIVAFFWLILTGFTFYFSVAILTQGPSDYTVMQVFFGIFFIWLAQLLIMPVLTMRTLSEEYRLGTFEGLMTAPVRDWEVVLAKFASVMAFYIVLWLPTVFYPILFKMVTLSQAPISSGPVWCGYLMALLIGMLFASVGLLASALTRNQIIAAVVAFAVTTLFFFAGFLVYFDPPQLLRNILDTISVYDHMEQFSKGLISTRVAVFYLSVTAVLLLATQKVLESKRWKA